MKLLLFLMVLTSLGLGAAAVKETVDRMHQATAVMTAAARA